MNLPFKLKWLGPETEDACASLAPYQPLIHVQRAPAHCEPIRDLTALPYSVTRVIDLSDAPRADDDRAPENGRGPTFEVSRLEYTSRELSSVYEFYFEVYSKSTALAYLRGQALYTYVEWLHQDLLAQRFVAFARAFADRKVVAGCLLKRFSASGAYDGEGPPEEDSALREENTVGVALCAAHPQHASPELYTSLLARAGEWARREGYSFLAAASEPGLVVDGGRENAAWLFGSKTKPFLHRGVGALLYCDLGRCSYLPRDFYFYSCEGTEPCLHYVANVSPGASRAVPFLSSLKGIRKLAHTRRGETRGVLSKAGFDCELL